MARHLKKVLKERGIESVLRNDDASLISLSELAPIVNWPEIWVQDSRAAEAEEIIREAVGSEPTIVRDNWQCPQCDERHAGSFNACWKCGATRPEV